MMRRRGVFLLAVLLLALTAGALGAQQAGAPTFRFQPENQTAQVGGSVTLEVRGYALPAGAVAEVSRLVVYRKTDGCVGNLYPAEPFTDRLSQPAATPNLILSGQRVGSECFYAQFEYVSGSGTVDPSAVGRFRMYWQDAPLVSTGTGRGIRESLLWWTPGGAYTILMTLGIGAFLAIFIPYRTFNGAAAGLIAMTVVMGVVIPLFGIPIYAFIFLALPIFGAFSCWKFGG